MKKTIIFLTICFPFLTNHAEVFVKSQANNGVSLEESSHRLSSEQKPEEVSLTIKRPSEELSLKGASALDKNYLEEAVDISHVTTPSKKSGYFYLQLSGGKSDITDKRPLHPGVGIGYRYVGKSAMVDFLCSGLGVGARSSSQMQWHCPRLSYLVYLSSFLPDLYLGPSISWGGISFYKEYEEDKHLHTRQVFAGLIAGCLIGYDFSRGEDCMTFLQMNITQPALPTYMRGYEDSYPGVSINISTGLGF